MLGFPLPSSAVVLAGLLALLGGAVGAGADDGPGGRPLVEALDELRGEGVDLVYTTRLVRRSMRAGNVPPSGSVAERLEALLRPHHLRALRLASGAFLVVAQEQPAEPLVLRGQVLSGHSGRPLYGASVRIVHFEPSADDDATPPAQDVTTGPDGAFHFEGLAAGVYRIRASRDDHRSDEQSVALHGTVSRPTVGPRVALRLQPVPFLVEEIAVRGSRSSLRRTEAEGSRALVAGALDAQPRLGDDLFRALPFLPGVTATDLSAQPLVRGARADEVRVVLDGQEIFSPYHLPDYDNGLGAIPSQDLGSVDLVSGNFSVEHGDRMGAVLDLRTRTLPSAPAEVRLGASVVDLEASLSGTGRNGDASWLLTTRRGSLDLAERLFDQPAPRFRDTHGRSILTPGPRHELRGQGLVTDDTLGFTETDDGETERLDTERGGRQFWIDLQSVLHERLLVLTRASSATIDHDRRGEDDEEEQRVLVDETGSSTIVDVEQSWTAQLTPSSSLHFGASWRRLRTDRRYRGDAERQFELVSAEIVPSRPPEEATVSLDDRNVGAYLGALLQVGAALHLEPGVRFDRTSAIGESRWSPRLNAALRIGDDQLLRLGWGVFRQTQRPNEVDLADGRTVPAPGESSEHALIGYERRFERGALDSLRVELYRRDISDPRPRFLNLFEPHDFFAELESDRVGVEPLRSRAHGLEIQLSGTTRRHSWWINYSLSRAEDLIAGGGASRWVPRETDQTHSLSLASTTVFGDWQLAAALRLHSGWPTTPVHPTGAMEEDDGPVSLQLGPLHDERLGSYQRLDLRVSRDVPLRRGTLTFFLDVQNVLDRENPAGFDLVLDDEEGTLDPEPERWPGIFPSVGVRWTF